MFRVSLQRTAGKCIGDSQIIIGRIRCFCVDRQVLAGHVPEDGVFFTIELVGVSGLNLIFANIKPRLGR